MVARYGHTYQQGIERFWSRKSMFDYYWPEFANIGEQAVLNKEIYAQGNVQDDEGMDKCNGFKSKGKKPGGSCEPLGFGWGSG